MPPKKKTETAAVEKSTKKPTLEILVKYHDQDLGKIEKIPVGDWIDLRSAETVDMEAGDFKIISLEMV